MKALHDADVLSLQRQVRFFYSQKKKIKIYHGSTNSTRIQIFQSGSFVDISQLNRIIEINPSEQYVVVEPNVPMDVLVQESLKYGLIPPVVMEFPGITVGGAIQGGAGESSSFKYGGFHNCCLEYEIVLGDGQIISASPEENSDLFWGTACSYGSLGIITQVKVRLVLAKKFVDLTYLTVNSFQEMVDVIQKKITESFNFVDSIMFSENLGVVMVGSFSEKIPAKKLSFHKFTDEWFYLHAQDITNRHGIYTELIPVKDYLFRYNRGAFWLGKYAFKKMKIPFNRATRALLDPFTRTRNASRLAQASSFSQKLICQDVCLPVEQVVKFLDFANEKFSIYPLWIMPARPAGELEKLCPNLIDTKLVIDIGLYGGLMKGNFANFFAANRELEQAAIHFGGRKVLYAHQYYDLEEFWSIYDRDWYEKLRTKYCANDIFFDVYEKTHVAEEYSQPRLLSLWKLVKSPFKLPTN